MTEAEARARAIAMFREATPEAVDAPIEEYRQGFEDMADKIPLPADLIIEQIEIEGVPCYKVTAPGAQADRLVVHFHSGGYVMGSARAYREFGGRLSAATRAPVILPDYRLAPEHPYPAPVEDGLKVYQWCISNHPPEKFLLSGDSAGGGLCIATLMNARDRGLPLPCGALGIAPLTDLAGEGNSANIDTDPLIQQDLIVGMGKVYVGDLDPKKEPLASPLWGDHRGLPPIMLIASSTEALRDDAVRLAVSIGEARGKVRLSLHDDLVHIWTFFPFLEATREAMDEIANFAEARFGN